MSKQPFYPVGIPWSSRDLPTHQVSRLRVSCPASCHKETCSWKPERQFNISFDLRQEYWFFHQMQWPMTYR